MEQSKQREKKKKSDEKDTTPQEEKDLRITSVPGDTGTGPKRPPSGG